MKTGSGENIIIIGGVGTARNIIDQVLDAINNYSYNVSLKGIILDSLQEGSLISSIPVIGGLKDIPKFINDESIKFLFALLKPEKLFERYLLMETLKIPLKRFINFSHPLSYLSDSMIIGTGNIVLSNSSIQSNVVLGNMNIINSNVTIEHDTNIGNGNFLAANSCIGSNVKIGNHCFIGLNSTVRENVRLEENVFVGMHSLVLNDFSNDTVAGVPAKKYLRKNCENSF